MKDDIAELFALEDNELFSRARSVGRKRPTILCAPNPIIGACTTRPTCRHCRWENAKALDSAFRLKKTTDEMLKRTDVIAQAGVHRMVVASGWMGYDVPAHFCECIRAIKDRFNLEIFGLFGAVSPSSLAELKEAGMDGYQCGLESPNERVYRGFRPGGDSLEDRKHTLFAARNLGLKLWSGFLVGVGESRADIAAGLAFLDTLGLESISILPFIPQPHTKMWGANPANPLQWARVVAIARLLMPGPNVFFKPEGFYGDYAILAGANGCYVFPGRQEQRRYLQD